MGKFCTNCGMENDQQAKFCIGCATPFMVSQSSEQPQSDPVPVQTSQSEAPPKVEPQQAYVPSTPPAPPAPPVQQSYQQPQNYQRQQQGQYQNQSPASPVNIYNQGAGDKPFSIGGWIGLFALTIFLPVIGYIIALIIALTSENKTLRNYGKAQLILLGASVVLWILVFVVITILGFSFASML